jgi:hypothetical protein
MARFHWSWIPSIVRWLFLSMPAGLSLAGAWSIRVWEAGAAAADIEAATRATLATLAKREGQGVAAFFVGCPRALLFATMVALLWMPFTSYLALGASNAPSRRALRMMAQRFMVASVAPLLLGFGVHAASSAGATWQDAAWLPLLGARLTLYALPFCCLAWVLRCHFTSKHASAALWHCALVSASALGGFALRRFGSGAIWLPGELDHYLFRGEAQHWGTAALAALGWSASLLSLIPLRGWMKARTSLVSSGEIMPCR